MEKIKKSLFVGMIASESIHIFCCVLPTIFSVLSLLAGFGLIATMPGFIEDAHHIIHDYEIFIMSMSCAILIIGWGLYLYSRKINCATDGNCAHKPCGPKKDRTRVFMTIATILFLCNILVYFTIHRQQDLEAYQSRVVVESEYHDDHAEHHHHH